MAHNPQLPRKGGYKCRICKHKATTLGSLKHHHFLKHARAAKAAHARSVAAKRAKAAERVTSSLAELPTIDSPKPYPGSGVRPNFCPSCGERLARWTRRA